MNEFVKFQCIAHRVEAIYRQFYFPLQVNCLSDNKSTHTGHLNMYVIEACYVVVKIYINKSTNTAHLNVVEHLSDIKAGHSGQYPPCHQYSH